MFSRRHTKLIDGADYSYWSLVKTVRTPKGPRHQTVAHLGKLDADEVNSLNGWSDLDALLEFGRVYLALALWRRLGLDKLLRKLMPAGAEDVGWDLVACVLTIARFCEQPSELGVVERWYADTALKDLLGVAEEKVNDARMYRGMVSEQNLSWMRERGAKYLVGTPKRQLREFEKQLLEKADWQQVWARQAHGAYLLRTNEVGLDGAQFWKWYIQLTQAEGAFRVQKSDLGLRPVFHQKTHRVQGHIPVCFFWRWRCGEYWSNGWPAKDWATAHGNC